MKTFAFLFLLTLPIFFFHTLQGQDYRICNASTQTHFERTAAFASHKQKEILTLSFDSTYATASHLELYNFESLDIFSGGGCYPVQRNSWIGKKIVQFNASGDVAFNINDDSVYFQNLNTVGNSFTMFRFFNGDFLTAELTSIAYDSLLSITDSIKSYTLQVFNSSAQPISHIFNGREFRVSKNYGLTKAFSILNFPVDTTVIYIAGLSNPAIGAQNLTNQQIFDFAIGDEFHYHYHFEPNITNYIDDKTIKRIIQKSFSAGNDTVIYSATYCTRREQFNSPNFTTSYYSDTVELKFSLITNDRINYFTDQIFDTLFSPSGSLDNAGSLQFYKDTLIINRIKKKVRAYYYFDSFNNCYTEIIGTGVFPVRTYAPGLGEVLMEDYSCMSFPSPSCYDSLVYYRKGNDTWGKTLGTCSTLLSNNNLTGDHPLFNLYPNPAKNQLHFECTDHLLKNINKIEIKNVIGENVKSLTDLEIKNQAIDISALMNGVYFIKINATDKLFTLKFIKH